MVYKIQNKLARMACAALVGVMALAAGLLHMGQPVALVQAQSTAPLNCSANYQIVQTLTNGAKWEMCWEPRAGYAYRLITVFYTPPNGLRRLVLNTMNVAQLFVPYDDNGPRYFDISYGRNLTTLTAAECPGGTLLTNSTLCLVRRPAGYAYKDVLGGALAQRENMVLFGYFSVGNYYYIIQYTFADDGAIEPAVGASGSLQRFGGNTSTGWPVKAQVGINHNHRVIWRMDFDIGDTANDLVEQIDYNGNTSDSRNATVTALTKEAKAQNNLEGLRFWRVRDTVLTNADGHSLSYEIEPSLTDQYRSSESFTQNDFYVTQFKTGETIVDDGSGLDSFVNNEVVNDVVVWYGVNFHHVPRDEDDVRMPAHFQSFVMRPRDLEAGVVGGNSATPTPAPTPIATALPTPTPIATALPTPTPTPLPTNTIILLRASQSSIGFGGDPARAIDGNTNGIYNANSTTHTNNEANAWWQADLGASYAITNVMLWNRTDCCADRLSSFYVFVSNTDLTGRTVNNIVADSSVWRTQITGQAPTSLNVPVNVTGRYVRVQLAGTNYLSLAEVQVFGSAVAGVSTNVALGKTVSASSSAEINGSWSKPYATDGLASAANPLGWSSDNSTGASHTEWLSVDLGAVNTISQVVLMPRLDGANAGYGFPVDFVIEVSQDNTIWTTVASRTGFARPAGTAQAFAFAATTARYVRITGTKLQSIPNDSNKFRMQFAEVQVFGYR